MGLAVTHRGQARALVYFVLVGVDLEDDPARGRPRLGPPPLEDGDADSGAVGNGAGGEIGHPLQGGLDALLGQQDARQVGDRVVEPVGWFGHRLA